MKLFWKDWNDIISNKNFILVMVAKKIAIHAKEDTSIEDFGEEMAMHNGYGPTKHTENLKYTRNYKKMISFVIYRTIWMI